MSDVPISQLPTYRYGMTDEETAGWVEAHSVEVEARAAGEAFGQLTFLDVSLANRSRALRWHRDATQHWNGADWTNALGGEIGELVEAVLNLVAAGGRMQNHAKKVRRLEEGLTNTKDDDKKIARLLEKIGNEAADVALYLDLVCAYFGIELPEAIRDKFNEVSKERGFPERL